MKISFLGDIALVGNYNDLYEKSENPFSDLSDVLLNSDFVIGNLECIAEGEKGENLLKKPRLKTKLQTLNYLRNLNISAVTLAHNHIYDNLEDGFDKTTKFLENNNIEYLGAGYSDALAGKPLFIEKDRIKICFLNYVTPDTNPNLPDNCPIKLNWFDEEIIKNDIEKYRANSKHIVLLLHWGGDYEGSVFPNPKQSEVGRRLIDYGADLIIGHHSHTFQPYEIYKGKYIFHSLGNFCFADFESDGQMNYVWRKSRLESALLNIDFNELSYIIEIQPIINLKNKIYFKSILTNKYNNCNNIFSYLIKSKLLWEIFKFFLIVDKYFSIIVNPNVSIKSKVSLIKNKLFN